MKIERKRDYRIKKSLHLKDRSKGNINKIWLIKLMKGTILRQMKTLMISNLH